MPTSTTATSTGASANAAYAIPTTVSKNDSGWAGVLVDQVRDARDVVVGREELLLGQRLAVQRDPLGHRLDVRAGEPAGAQPESRATRVSIIRAVLVLPLVPVRWITG